MWVVPPDSPTDHKHLPELIICPRRAKFRVWKKTTARASLACAQLDQQGALGFQGVTGPLVRAHSSEVGRTRRATFQAPMPATEPQTSTSAKVPS